MNSPDDFDDLEAELIALGDSLDIPAPSPADVAAAVHARLTSTPSTEGHAPTTSPEGHAPKPSPTTSPEGHAPKRPPTTSPDGRPPKRPGKRRARWRVVTAVVLAVIALTAATPQGRAAVVRILSYAGIELRVGDPAPAPATPALLPGERAVPPEDLAGLVKFPIRTPTRLDPPQRATVSDNGRVASMFWPDGVRLDQFDGTLSPYFFKQIGPPWPQEVRMAGGTGWWLGGEHPLGYISRQDGTQIPLRQARPTLIWQLGQVGYRLEGAGTKERAAEIGGSLS